MIKNYVEFIYAGTFLSESSTEAIGSRNQEIVMPEGAYGYRLFDRVEHTIDGELLVGKGKNYSAWHYKGEVYDAERVEREVPNSSVLLSNMRINGWSKVLKCNQGFIPLRDNDVVIRKEGDMEVKK